MQTGNIHIEVHQSLPECDAVSAFSFHHSHHFYPFFFTEVDQPLLESVGPRLALSQPLVPRTPGAGPEAVAVSTHC